MATRTAHPLALRLLQAVTDRLSPDPVPIRNPFEWLTKAEVVAKVAAHGAQDWIGDTVSCTSLKDQSRAHTHCGTCVQCQERRFAILSLGLADSDPARAYLADVVLGGRGDDRARAMGLSWLTHARFLREVTPEAFQSRFAGELARIREGYPQLSAREVFDRSLALHRRHGETVVGVFGAAVSERSGDLAAGRLPQDCLLVAGIAGAAASRAPAMPRSEPVGAEDLAAVTVAERTEGPPEEGSPEGLAVSFFSEGGRDVVAVRDLGRVEGRPAAVAAALRPAFEEDRAEGRGPDAHRHVAAGSIAARTGQSKSAVVQNVRRCRHQLADLWKELHGQPTAEPLLIQNRPQSGYRLDPAIRLVDGAAREDG